MPRIIVGHEQRRPLYPDLVAELVDELRSNRPYGQPVIREQRFPTTNLAGITVIWDKWERLSDANRIEAILQAYDQVEGEGFRNQIAMAAGLTVPEACEDGLLPFQVTTAVRESDPVTLEQCREAMKALGASVLANPDRPALRFAAAQEAEQCVRQLVERLPGSEAVWIVTQEVARIAD